MVLKINWYFICFYLQDGHTAFEDAMTNKKSIKVAEYIATLIAPKSVYKHTYIPRFNENYVYINAYLFIHI